MKYIHLTVLSLLLHTCVYAQSKKHRQKITFTSIPQVGILEGQTGKTTAQLQWISGLSRDTWFGGIGVGIDYYGGKRSLPLFADFRKLLFSSANTPFIYADAGYNFSWLRDNQKAYLFPVNDFNQTGGLFYDIGFGYKFLLMKKMALGFSGGYSFKQQGEKYLVTFFCDRCLPREESYEYKLRRLSIKMSCWF